jgi:predicted  nucleic acid-binding Zn-ribbon protein
VRELKAEVKDLLDRLGDHEDEFEKEREKLGVLGEELGLTEKALKYRRKDVGERSKRGTSKRKAPAFTRSLQEIRADQEGLEDSLHHAVSAI